MPQSLEEGLDALQSLLARIVNPRVACENRCSRTITLQYAPWGRPDETVSRWTCDATAECGHGNEHFCRFAAVTADGYGDTPADAASECLEKLAAMVHDREETEALEAEEE